MIPPGVHDAKPGSPRLIAPKELVVTSTTSHFRRDGLERCPLIEVRAYGVLQQDAVHRQADKPRLDARLRTTRPLHPYVRHRSRNFTHQHRCQARRHTDTPRKLCRLA